MVVAISQDRTVASVTTKWSPIQDGLQLGIEASARTPATQPALRLLLKNAGSEERVLPIGFEGLAGPVYNVTITAVRAGGQQERPVFDLYALKKIREGSRRL